MKDVRSNRGLSERQMAALRYAKLQHQNGHRVFDAWPVAISGRTIFSLVERGLLIKGTRAIPGERGTFAKRRITFRLSVDGKLVSS